MAYLARRRNNQRLGIQNMQHQPNTTLLYVSHQILHQRTSLCRKKVPAANRHALQGYSQDQFRRHKTWLFMGIKKCSLHFDQELPSPPPPHFSDLILSNQAPNLNESSASASESPGETPMRVSPPTRLAKMPRTSKSATPSLAKRRRTRKSVICSLSKTPRVRTWPPPRLAKPRRTIKSAKTRTDITPVENRSARTSGSDIFEQDWKRTSLMSCTTLDPSCFTAVKRTCRPSSRTS